VFATVRTPEQTAQVEALGEGIEPLTLDLSNHNQVKQAVVDNNSEMVSYSVWNAVYINFSRYRDTYGQRY